MKKILVIGASSSSKSINQKLAVFSAKQLSDIETQVIDLNEFELPIYSEDREEKLGTPELADQFVKQVESTDGIVLSLAEHNGSYTAAFKNLLDWASRSKQKVWSEKPMLLLATSPGPRGAMSVLDAAKATFPHLGADVVGAISLPSFYENFDSKNGILDVKTRDKLNSLLKVFEEKL